MSNVLEKRIKHWEMQLLDFGKRNKMINYRDTKRSTLRIIEPSIDDFFKRLAISEEHLTFQKSVDHDNNARIFSLLSLLDTLSSPIDVAIGDIRAETSFAECQKTLKNLRAKARLSLEEQGTNILYLSFGFIEWRNGKGSSAQLVKSPLILVPVVLTLDSINAPYTLSKHEDDIVVNPTLEYYFKTEYGISLPNFDSDKDDINEYLNSLEEFADQRGWRIIREVSLGLLSFLKISMYNDLICNEDRIKSNPVIRALTGEINVVNDITEDLETFDLDSIKTKDCYQVMSADSSQQDAILYSKKNISFVMQGPPGTGKSQTITNIIAEALADGKKVLFVAEKMAALQVVYHRLQESHLGEFCLPLHSYKANKKEILEQIGENLKLKSTDVKDSALEKLEELSQIRQELNQYAEDLHKKFSELNLSFYDVYSKLEEVVDVPTVAFSFENPTEISRAQFQRIISSIENYELSIQRIDNRIHNNPWEGLSATSSGYQYTEEMRKNLNALKDKLGSIINVFDEIKNLFYVASCLPFEKIPEFAEAVLDACSFSNIPSEWLYRNTLGEFVSKANEAKEKCDTIISLKESITKVFISDILQFDIEEWQESLLKNTNELNSFSYIDKQDTLFFILNAQNLKNTFIEIQDILESINSIFDSINDLLGTKFSPNELNSKYISELLNLIKSNRIIPNSWFDVDISKLINKVKELREKTEKFSDTKKQILTDWEIGAFELDYAPILARYKTKYTSVFKIFNSQYHRDKKQIQLLSKTVIKKLTDDITVKLLLSLKDYHEQNDALTMQFNELQNELGIYFNGIETNWDELLAALGIIAELKNLPKKCLTDQLENILANDHIDLITKLGNLSDSLISYFSQLKKIIISSKTNMNIAVEEYDGKSAAETVINYISNLDNIINLKYNFETYFINNEISIETAYNELSNLSRYQALYNEICKNDVSYRKLFGTYYQGLTTDWEYILNLLKKIECINKLSEYIPLESIIDYSNDDKHKIAVSIEKIKSLYKSSKDLFAWLCAQFTAESICNEKSISELYYKVSDCIDNISMLEGWIDYREAKSECNSCNISNFIIAIEQAGIFTNIEKVFLKKFYQSWLDEVGKKIDSVRRFRRNVHDARIDKFTNLDDLQLKISQMRIREKLIKNLPSSHKLLKATDEVTILNKELGKKIRIMPLRKLFKQIPNLLLTLKPCLMMSPLSVSYFLETEAYHFDLVIFDEASQIFPEDAIGAIFRGSQVIIAGDSKQLPPTNFFATTANNPDSEYDTNNEDDFDEDLSASILEESATVLPNRTLLWHYRSKHESLIAFSNREIYKNNLITFPNNVIKVPDMGVEYIYVENGYYEGGGKNCNIREAQKCVMLVLQHIQRHPKRSLGIIAFSEKQQNEIEKAILQFRIDMPEYEWFFDESKEEPFFVKNLENVQGDERDTIIFSICYAKDQNGKMYMRFGPLGNNGGERRLNVAITRAKCNIKLVGSILPTDIDLNRTNSEGVRMLRSYIEFAQKGTIALKPVEKGSSFDCKDDFCKAIVDFLERHGYSVHTHIGCSDYKIDIAVCNPNNEDEYIAGIECDGLSYIQARTARDRDHLRASVLKNMGWNLYRIWSTEWNRNPETEGKALLEFLASVIDKSGNVVHTIKQGNEDETISLEQIASEKEKTDSAFPADNPYGFDLYEIANWWEADKSSSDKACDTVLHIVSIEQPMHIELLYRRMVPFFGTGKITDEVKNTVDKILKIKLKNKVLIDQENFVRIIPSGSVIARIPQKCDTPRPIEYIHTEEIFAAVIKIVGQSYGITEKDLETEVASAFGYERKGPRIKKKIQSVIQKAVASGKINIIDGKVTLV